VRDLEVAHNTHLGREWGVYLLNAPAADARFVLRDNVLGSAYGLGSASGVGTGTTALDHHVPGAVMAGNVVIGGGPTGYPGGNVYAASAAAAGLSADLRVVGGPAAALATTDGLPPGADRAAVEQRTAGVVVAP
jgi:hypothetical protein